MRKQLNLITVMIALVFITTSCVQKRPDIDAQGSNLANLKKIGALNNTECTITTLGGESVSRPMAVTDTDAKLVGDYLKFPVVRNIVATDCPLLNDENTKTLDFMSTKDDSGKGKGKLFKGIDHKVIYKIEQDNLVIYKVISKSELSHVEKTSATIKNNKAYVPVGGFPISAFYNVEQSRNSDNRDTNVSIKVQVPKEDYKKADGSFAAKYIAISKAGLAKFNYQNKSDVMPKSYFEQGEWYYNVMTMDKSLYSGGMVGGHGGHVFTQGSYKRASLIKFSIDQDYLYALSLTVDEDAEAETILNLPVALKINVDNLDYRREQTASGSGLGEENTEIVDNKKDYIKLNYGSATQPSGNGGFLSQMKSLLSSSDPRKSVVAIDYASADYFSFTVESAAEGKVKYSFMRKKDRDYEKKTAHITDMNRFGYFTTKVSKEYDETTNTFKDFQELVLLNRFNPKKDIVYHFSTITPKDKWVRDIGRQAIKLWNQAFQKAGLTTTITLNESMDVGLGDIRYNVLNIMDDKFRNNPSGGLGQSVNDPMTGESISATANVYMKTATNYYMLRKYMKSVVGDSVDFTNRVILDTSQSENDMIMGLINGNRFQINEDGTKNLMSVYRWTDDSQSSMTNAPFKNDLNELILENYNNSGENVLLPSINVLSSLNNQSIYDGGNNLFEGLETGSEGPGLAFNKDIGIFIKNKCPEVAAYIATLTSGNKRDSTIEENEKLKNCVTELTQYYELGATIHEVGHNLGLRHNFFASYDKENRIATNAYVYEDIDVHSYGADEYWSSIMDYPNFINFSNTFLLPGYYDIASLRFGYKSEIELASSEEQMFKGTSEFITIPDDISIDNFLLVDNKKRVAKKYKYCTDIDGRTSKNEIFCALSDHGDNATEIVTNHANSIIAYISERALRFDAHNSSQQLDIINSLAKMKAFYDEWRNLVAANTGKSRQYLQGYDQEEYQALITKMLDDPINGEKHKDFLQARNIYVNLLLDLTYLPNKYCVGVDSEDKHKLIELSTIREVLQTQNYAGKVESCKHTKVVKYLEDQGLTLQNEIGYFLNGGRYSLDKIFTQSVVGSNMFQMDFSGTMTLRAQAALMFGTRYTEAYDNRIKGFTPNLLDEPDIREITTKLLMKRLIDGVFLKQGAIDPNSYATAKLFDQADIDERIKGSLVYQNYLAEGLLVESFYRNFFMGLYVPGDSDETTNRREEFSTGLIADERILDSPKHKAVRVTSSRYLYVTKEQEAGYASEMIDIIKAIDSAKTSSESDEPQVTAENITPEVIAEAKASTMKLMKEQLIKKDKITFGIIFAAGNKAKNELDAMTDQPVKKLLMRSFYEKLYLGLKVQIQHFIKVMSESEYKIRPRDDFASQVFRGVPENYDEIEDFVALAVVAEGEQKYKPDEVTTSNLNKGLKEFLNRDITANFYEHLQMYRTEQSHTAFMNEVLENTIKDLEDIQAVGEQIDEKLSQKKLLLNVLLMSIQ